MNIFLINFLVYLLSWLFFYKQVNRISLFMIAWSGFTISALMSYFLINYGIYNYSVDSSASSNIGPLFCVLVTNLIVSLPFKKIDERKIRLTDVNIDTPLYKMFVGISMPFFFVVAILKIYEAVVVSSVTTYGDVYSMMHDEDATMMLRDLLYGNSILRTISGVGGSYCPTMAPLMIIYFFNIISRQRKAKYYHILCIIITLIPTVLQGVSNASRGNLFFSFFQILFYYIIIRNYLGKKIRNIIVFSSVFFLIGILGVSYAITESRVEARKSIYSAQDDIFIYFGQPMINACYFQDKIKYHPMGKRMLDIREHAESSSFKDYWNDKTGGQVQLFKTYYGDVFLEFGLLLAFLFIVCYTFLWDKIILKHYQSPMYLPFVWLYFNTLIYGIFNFKYSIMSTGIWFILLIILCVTINSQSKARLIAIKLKG